MAVAQDSTTIRVSKRARTRLQTIAAARGVTLGQLVADLAYVAYRDHAFASEREASRLDALNPAVAEEDALWEETLADGSD